MSNQVTLRYPENALATNNKGTAPINPGDTMSIADVFAERVKLTPSKNAYGEHDGKQWVDYTWQQTSERVDQWRKAFSAMSLQVGDRVAIRADSCMDWICFDQAAAACGLVVVPIYANDRADNIAYILSETAAGVFFTQNADDWADIADEATLPHLQRVIVDASAVEHADARLLAKQQWLDEAKDVALQQVSVNVNDTATIVFTSGTTGKPKGVMLSHHNVMSNAYAGLQSERVYDTDHHLSFLPLSHMFERTVGYYLQMLCGSQVTFTRGIDQLLDDLAEVKPTVMITVPRIFERAQGAIKGQLEASPAWRQKLFNFAVDMGYQRFLHKQGRADAPRWNFLWPLLDKLVAAKVKARFGGRLRFVITGGAPMAPQVSRLFVGMGFDILQGYGLTETSPILSVNTIMENKPASIGLPLHGTELKIAENGELLARGAMIMQGYLNNPEETAKVIDADGWFHTGDIAAQDSDGFFSITGRIKEIIVLANGEKVPPADLEAAICDDPLFEQAMVMGEGKAFLSALLVLNPDSWQRFAKKNGLATDDAALNSDEVKAKLLERVSELINDFPGYANIYKAHVTLEPWSLENGAMTPTLKLKRPVLRERFKKQREEMYEGH